MSKPILCRCFTKRLSFWNFWDFPKKIDLIEHWYEIKNFQLELDESSQSQWLVGAKFIQPKNGSSRRILHAKMFEFYFYHFKSFIFKIGFFHAVDINIISICVHLFIVHETITEDDCLLTQNVWKFCTTEKLKLKKSRC